jgi:hypothetical protein
MFEMLVIAICVSDAQAYNEKYEMYHLYSVSNFICINIATVTVNKVGQNARSLSYLQRNELL